MRKIPWMLILQYGICGPIVMIAGCRGGLADSIEKTVRDAKNGPTDNTGKTSIVVEYDNGDWCELRGPARFTLLNEWEGRNDGS